jgi:hypothetical protein
MSLQDSWILLGVGLGFCLLGLVVILWGRHEARRYDHYLSRQRDLREYVEHWPERPQPGALVIGGWIAVALGFVLAVVGAVFLWLATRPA